MNRYNHRGLHIFRYLMFFIPLFWAGCVKNEIKVEYQLPSNVNDAYRMVYYASDPVKGWFVETVAAVQGGKAQVICATANPTIVYIPGAGSVPKAAFYAERGDKIKITGEGSDPYSWNISGNRLTEEWNVWRLDNKTVLSSGDYSKINTAVEKYVKANQDNPLSTLLLLIYFNRREDDSRFRGLWQVLKGKALEPKWMQLVGRGDMPGGSPVVPHKVQEMILHTFGNGVDTLHIGNQPVLLYFWREKDAGREDRLILLKKLVEDFPDSTSRIIADVCFDPDSIGWMSVVRKDSLSRVVRGWNFHAETDSLMIRAGVSRTPWFMVFDESGKAVYVGDKSDDADKAFRKTADKKAPKK